MSTRSPKRRSSSPRKTSKTIVHSISLLVNEKVNKYIQESKMQTFQPDEDAKESPKSARLRTSSDFLYGGGSPIRRNSRSQSRRRPSRSRSDEIQHVNAGRPTLCKDQVRSMRMLIASNDILDDNNDAILLKRARKQKAREMKKQLERLAVLNSQFHAIQNLLDAACVDDPLTSYTNFAEIDKQSQEKNEAKTNNVDTVTFDPFLFDDSPVKPSSKPPVSRELSFRDLLSKNQRFKSIRDLSRLENITFSNTSPKHNDVWKYNPKDADKKEFTDLFDHSNFVDEDVDFETIVWGYPSFDKGKAEGHDKEDDALQRNQLSESRNENVGRRSEKQASRRKTRNSSLVLNDHTNLLPHSDTNECKNTISAEDEIFESFERRLARRCSGESYESNPDSINTHTSGKKESAPPLKKKKKKVPHVGSEKNSQLSFWEDNIRVVSCSGKYQANTVEKCSKNLSMNSDFELLLNTQPSPTAKKISSKLSRPVKDKYKIDQLLDFDPQKTPGPDEVIKIKASALVNRKIDMIANIDPLGYMGLPIRQKSNERRNSSIFSKKNHIDEKQPAEGFFIE